MIDNDIYEALVNHTQAVATALSLRVAWPEVAFAPNNNETFLEVTHFKNSNGNPSWGSEVIKQGIWQVSVVVNGDRYGVITPTDLAEQVAAAFKKNTRIFITGTSIKCYQHPNLLSVITDPGKATYPVSIPYQVVN